MVQFSLRLSDHRDRQMARMRRAAMLEDEDALPRPELHPSAVDGDGLGAARQHHAGMARPHYRSVKQQHPATHFEDRRRG